MQRNVSTWTITNTHHTFFFLFYLNIRFCDPWNVCFKKPKHEISTNFLKMIQTYSSKHSFVTFSRVVFEKYCTWVHLESSNNFHYYFSHLNLSRLFFFISFISLITIEIYFFILLWHSPYCAEPHTIDYEFSICFFLFSIFFSISLQYAKIGTHCWWMFTESTVLFLCSSFW